MNGSRMNGSNGSAALYYASRPVISVDGEVQTLLGDALLLSLLVEETTRGLFRCEARFTNWEPSAGETFRFFDGEILDFGKPFAVEMGKPDELRQIFDGRIMGIEAHYPAQRPPEIVVLAEDRFQDLRMVRHTRTFEDMTDADVVRQIAAAQGLTAEVDIDGPTYRTLVQLNQSDLAFLRERAAAVDADLWIEGSMLHVQSRTGRDEGTISLTYGGNLVEFSALADLAHQRSTVRVSGWDVSGKQAIDVEAGAQLIQSELNGDRGGSAVLEQAIAARHERIATAMPLSQPEAQALADARYRERARRFVTGTGVVDGTAELRVGATVEIDALGPWFDGAYYVTRARHVFDVIDGYRTFFEVERPGLGT